MLYDRIISLEKSIQPDKENTDLYNVVRILANKCKQRSTYNSPDKYLYNSNPFWLYSLSKIYTNKLKEIASKKEWDKFFIKLNDILILSSSCACGKSNSQQLILRQLITTIVADNCSIPIKELSKINHLLWECVIMSNYHAMQFAIKTDRNQISQKYFFNKNTSLALFILYINYIKMGKNLQKNLYDHLENLGLKINIAGQSSRNFAFDFDSPKFGINYTIVPSKVLKERVKYDKLHHGKPQVVICRIGDKTIRISVNSSIFESQAVAVKIYDIIRKKEFSEVVLNISTAELLSAADKIGFSKQPRAKSLANIKTYLSSVFYGFGLYEKLSPDTKEIEKYCLKYKKLGLEIPKVIISKGVFRDKVLRWWKTRIIEKYPLEISINHDDTVKFLGQLELSSIDHVFDKKYQFEYDLFKKYRDKILLPYE